MCLEVKIDVSNTTPSKSYSWLFPVKLEKVKPGRTKLGKLKEASVKILKTELKISQNSIPMAPILTFSALKEQFPGHRLGPSYAKARHSYQEWFGRAQNRVTADEARGQIQTHMSELLTTYDTLCHALGTDEETRAFLSLYNPPAFRAACSQAARAEPSVELIRNYDFPFERTDRLLLHTNWNGTRVMAMTDCLWGVVDGMNEHGLAISLAYGGRNKKGEGFGITLVLRYILEFCVNTAEAVKTLLRVPVHMPYNITVTDKQGDIRTVTLCPGIAPKETSLAFATNHQVGGEVIDIDTLADSYTREQFLSTKLSDPREKKRSLLDFFLSPPLLRKASDWNGWGTLYTARYRPCEGSVELHWPNGQSMLQSFDNFHETDVQVTSPAFC